MYHGRFNKSHYEAGYHWGSLLYKNGKMIDHNSTFKITEERKKFAYNCLPVYEKYYPEILEEIKGLANSDFLVALENLYMNCLYKLDGVYSFNGNTTAFIEMEDGVNEHGLAVGLTFIYPKITKAGFNSGMLVRYLLEKCKTVDEVVDSLSVIPIASQQTLTVMDRMGHFCVIECNCNHVEVIKPEREDNFIVATNGFVSSKMIKYNAHGIDDWRSDERYAVAYSVLKENKSNFSIELVRDILSGKYGFMCQYDRKTGADTVWSVIYDIKNSKIFRVEGNPLRKKFIEDNRMKFI